MLGLRRWRSPSAEPSYDSIVRDSRLVRFNRCPPSTQFHNVIRGWRLGRGGKRRHFSNKFGNRHPTLCRFRFESDSGPFVDLDEALGSIH
jgi:hypothetical protein